MNWNTSIRFGLARGKQLTRACVNPLLATVFVLATGLSGCESTEPQSGPVTNEVANTRLAELTTADLKSRRLEVLARYAEIQRDLELKAGLPMGVAIKDDRALLGDLYREAHEIDRELLRRFNRGDPEVTNELVKAKW